MILHVLEHALIDSAKMLPFLLAAYLVIEYLEHRHSQAVERVLAGGGRFGAAPAAVLGLLPQCGFSAMAANLYASKVITLGTLLAVFITTSDEAIPVLAAHPDRWADLLALLAVKLAVALIVGFCVDLIGRRTLPESVRGGYTGHGEEVDCHEHHQEPGILRAALGHTVQIFVYILLFNLALGFLVEWVGEDAIGAFLAASGPLQPLLAGLFGLVPNCAASLLITQLFAAGQLSFGGCVAGLCSATGVGLAVLLRANKNQRQNLLITGLLLAVSVAAGYICSIF